MKFKKWMAVLFVLACVLGMTSCKKPLGGTPEDNPVKEESDAEEEEGQTYRFGFSGITMENPYFITLETSIREYIEKYDGTLITKDPALDAQLQVQQIQEMIDTGIDAIFLSPVDWEAITPALEALKDADVKIINIDTQVKELSYVDAYIGSDNREAGKLCADDLIEKAPKGGKVVILECPEQNSVNERITGFEETIAGKGFEVVTRQNVKGDLNNALAATEEILTNSTGITAIMCGNDQTALGALVAANSLNYPDILIYGVDGSPDLKKELLKDDTLIAGTAAQSPITIGKSAVETAFAILNKEDYEEQILEDVFFIDRSNVEMYGVDGWQ